MVVLSIRRHLNNIYGRILPNERRVSDGKFSASGKSLGQIQDTGFVVTWHLLLLSEYVLT